MAGMITIFTTMLQYANEYCLEHRELELNSFSRENEIGLLHYSVRDSTIQSHYQTLPSSPPQSCFSPLDICFDHKL